MTPCPYSIGFTHEGKAVPLYCGKWSCPRCRETLAKTWAWRASLHINNCGDPAYFWTLTLKPSIQTPYQGFKALPSLWDALRNKMQYRVKGWTYLAFVECHPKRSSIPHFHALSMVKAPTIGKHKSDPIKDLAFYSGFGYMATEELVTGWKAAWYVAKYASKHDPAIPRNFRRVRCSRDWTKLPEAHFDPYLVKGRAEHTWEFILRVSEHCDQPAETLLFRYRTACNLYEVGFEELD